MIVILWEISLSSLPVFWLGILCCRFVCCGIVVLADLYIGWRQVGVVYGWSCHISSPSASQIALTHIPASPDTCTPILPSHLTPITNIVPTQHWYTWLAFKLFGSPGECIMRGEAVMFYWDLVVCLGSPNPGSQIWDPQTDISTNQKTTLRPHQHHQAPPWTAILISSKHSLLLDSQALRGLYDEHVSSTHPLSVLFYTWNFGVRKWPFYIDIFTLKCTDIG